MFWIYFFIFFFGFQFEIILQMVKQNRISDIGAAVMGDDPEVATDKSIS